jgi:hypothetical protein
MDPYKTLECGSLPFLKGTLALLTTPYSTEEVSLAQGESPSWRGLAGVVRIYFDKERVFRI